MNPIIRLTSADRMMRTWEELCANCVALSWKGRLRFPELFPALVTPINMQTSFRLVLYPWLCDDIDAG